MDQAIEQIELALEDIEVAEAEVTFLEPTKNVVPAKIKPFRHVALDRICKDYDLDQEA